MSTDAERAWKHYAEQNEIIEGIRTINEQAAFEWGYGEGSAAAKQRIADVREASGKIIDAQIGLIASRDRELRMAEQRIAELEAEVESLRTDWNVAADMATVRAEAAEKERDEAKQDAEAFDERMKALLGKACSELARTEIELGDLRFRSEMDAVEIHTQTERADAAEAERNELRITLTEVRQDRNMLRDRCNELRRERDELAVRIDGAEVERDEWRLRGQAARAAITRVRNVIARIKTEGDLLEQNAAEEIDRALADSGHTDTGEKDV